MGERSKVYMTDLRCRPGVSLLNKLEKLMRTAGIGEINFERKLVAIKMHFGEPGNLAFLRPNYAKVVADVVKSLGGVPFLTDCNTLYPGRRKNALEHLDAAYENGFSPLSTGCQVIIGDGLRGNDDVEVPVEGAEYIQTAKIGKAIMEAVNPNTMQRALQELEARGLLNTQRTAGRTVTEDKTMIAQLREQLAAEQIGAFLQMMEKLGYTRAQTLALLQQKAQEE